MQDKSWDIAGFAHATAVTTYVIWYQTSPLDVSRRYHRVHDPLGERNVLAQPAEASSEVPHQIETRGLTKTQKTADETCEETQQTRQHRRDAAVMVDIQGIRKVKGRGVHGHASTYSLAEKKVSD